MDLGTEVHYLVSIYHLYSVDCRVHQKPCLWLIHKSILTFIVFLLMTPSLIPTPTRTVEKEEEIKPWWFWPHLHRERKLIVKLLDTFTSKFCRVTALGGCPKWWWDLDRQGRGYRADHEGGAVHLVNITTTQEDLYQSSGCRDYYNILTSFKS